MKKPYLLVVLLALFVAVPAVIAAPDGTLLQTSNGLQTSNEQGDVPEEADLIERVRKGVQKITLDNGLRVLIYRRARVPVFSGRVWIKVGGVNEEIGRTGIAHLLEHMAFKGTPIIGTTNYSKEKELLAQLEEVVSKQADKSKITDLPEVKAIHKELQTLWVEDEFARIYATHGQQGLNAGTSKDYTIYMVNLPSTALELWCWMESERLFNPVFRQFYLEREVVQEERRIRTDDDPDGKLAEEIVLAAYSGHPYRMPLVGWPSDLKQLTTSMMEEFYHKYYRPDNIVLTLVGDVDPVVARPLLNKYFGRLPVATVARPGVVTVEAEHLGERDVTVELDAEPAFFLAYPKPAYPDPDAVFFTLLSEVLADGRSSIFYRELILQKKLASYVNIYDIPGSVYPSLFSVYAKPQQGVSNQRLRDEVQLILERVKKEGFSDTQVRAAKRKIKVWFYQSLSSNGGISDMIGLPELLWNDWSVSLDTLAKLENATALDLQRITQRYLVKNKQTFAHREKIAPEKTTQEKITQEK